MDLAAHLLWFRAYVAGERARVEKLDPGPLDVKLEHTLAVLANARRIARGEGLGAGTSRACLLAALYHDVGRFEQYRRYGTFRDRESCDHGRLGVRILKREGRLAGASPSERRLVLSAVALHNRYALPPGLPPETALVVNALRDADKLDILRVMAAHLRGPGPYNPTVVLRLPDEPGLASRKVLSDALRGRLASYADLRSVNDFRVLLGTWLFDMHFLTSCAQFLADGHARELLLALPDEPPYREAKDFLLQRQLESARETSLTRRV